MVVRPELVVDKGRGGFFFYLKFYGVEWSGERAGCMQWVGIERGGCERFEPFWPLWDEVFGETPECVC